MNNLIPDSNQSIKEWMNRNYYYFDKLIPKYCKSFESKKILELGSGIGGFLNYLKLKGINDYIGVDNSEEQLEVCRSYVTDKIINDDAINFLKKNENSFDIIFLFDLIEHIKYSQIPEFTSLLYNTLNDNGKLLVRTPNMSVMTGLRSRYLDFTHRIGFTEESIKQVFSESNFSKIEVSNDIVGWKRLIMIRIFHRSLEKLYNIKPSKILTQNMIVIVHK